MTLRRDSRLPLALVTSALASACGGGAETATYDVTLADSELESGDGAITEVMADAEARWPALVVNEVAPAGLGGTTDPVNPGAPPDWLELANPTAAPVSLDGWTLTDSDPNHVYTFPAGTVLPAGGWLVVAEGAGGLDFGLGASDGVRLIAPDGAVVDQVDWTAESLPRTANLGRLPDQTGPFVPLYLGTPGAANAANPVTGCGDGEVEAPERCEPGVAAAPSCEDLGWGGGTPTCAADCSGLDHGSCTPRVAGLVLNEMTSSGDDRIELLNGTSAEVDLGGFTLSDDGGGSHALPAGTTLAAGARLVLVRDVDHGFGLGDSDGLTLRDASGAVVDAARWGSGEAVVSFCRRPDGVGGFSACPSASFGDPNF